MREGPALCSTQHGRACCRPSPSRTQPLATRSRSCSRFAIGYQLTADQLQVTIEAATGTATAHALTTLGWAAGPVDDTSRRLLTNALDTAARPHNPARLPVFAATARDLFRHASKTLTPHPAGHGLAAPFGPAANALHADLLAAVDALRHAARLRPRVPVTDRLLPEALSALQELYALFFSYLEHALQPLAPLVTPHAIRTFILETRHELDTLTARHTLGHGSIETLTITEPDGEFACIDVEISLRLTPPGASTPDVTSLRR